MDAKRLPLLSIRAEVIRYLSLAPEGLSPNSPAFQGRVSMAGNRRLIYWASCISPRIEIRVFDKAIVYCVDIRVAAMTLVFVRPADTRTSKDPDFQSGDEGLMQEVY